MSPFGYFWSRLCEEFPGRLPTELMEEMARLPVGLLEEIIEARQYARAYTLNRQHPKASGGLVDVVKAIEFELTQEEIDQDG